ncbi:MFS transporter [Embleya sp. AB8]|uniref:MFS transporter n=1 Tax=Embleya sp. AB8 TaxID=3156304 RepID=UPI003C78E6C9
MAYLRLLRQRRVLLLWLAETVSAFGDRFFTLALAWLAWERSGAVAMGLVVMVEGVPHLVIGAFGQRLVAWATRLRRLAVIEVAQVGVVASVPWLWNAFGVVGIMIVIALVGTADAVTEPALSTLVPDLVEEDRVQAVTGLVNLTGRLTWILGPASAGALLTVLSVPGLFLVDAATFLVSAAAFMLLGRRAGDGRKADVGAAEASTDGGEVEVLSARHVMAKQPIMGWAIGLATLGEFCACALNVGVMVLLTTRMDAGLGGYGLVVSAMAAGGLLGNLVAGNVRVGARWAELYCAVWIGRGLALAAFAVAGSLTRLLVVGVVAGALSPVGSIVLQARIGVSARAERLRLFTVQSTALHAACMAGMLVLPALVERAPRSAFVVLGALTTSGALVTWWASRVLTGPSPVAFAGGDNEVGRVDGREPSLDDEAVLIEQASHAAAGWAW